MRFSIKYLRLFHRCYRNFWSVLLSLMIGLDKIAVVLRIDQEKYHWEKIQVLNYVVANSLKYGADSEVELIPAQNRIKFNYKGTILNFYGFLYNGWIYKEMNEFEYKSLKFKDKIVIDAGANTGTTSIYLALNGAKKVFAIEPMPLTYTFLIRNVEMNDLTDRIICLNVALGGTEHTVNLDVKKSGLGAELSLSSLTEAYRPIRITTLGELIKQHQIRNCVIKMDCEGCEYDALLNLDDETMSHIDEIILEYHHGAVHLADFLSKNGFSVQNLSIQRKTRVGILHAQKI